MLGHVDGNDPRPHYFHQTNIARVRPERGRETRHATGGTLYAVVNTLLARYEAVFDRAKAPLLQLTAPQIGHDAGPAGRLGGDARGRHRHREPAGRRRPDHERAAPRAVDVPITGTSAGSDYGGQQSGWITVAPGAEQVLAPSQSIRRPQGQPRPATTPAATTDRHVEAGGAARPAS